MTYEYSWDCFSLGAADGRISKKYMRRVPTTNFQTGHRQCCERNSPSFRFFFHTGATDEDAVSGVIVGKEIPRPQRREPTDFECR